MHSKLKPIWDWWKGLPETSLPLFLFISGFLAAICWVISKIADLLFDRYYPQFHWRWTVNLVWVIPFFVAGIIFWREYRKSKIPTSGQLSFWNGWGIAVFFAVLFLIQKLVHPIGLASALPATGFTSSPIGTPTDSGYAEGNWPKAEQNSFDLACRFADSGRNIKMDDPAKATEDFEKGYVGLYALAVKYPLEDCWQKLSAVISNLSNAYGRQGRNAESGLASDAAIETQSMINNDKFIFLPDRMKSAEKLYDQLTNHANLYAP